MRHLSEREVDLLQSNSFRYHFRVKFEDADGNMVEYTDFEDDRNWIKRIEVSNDIDNASKEINFEIRRNSYKNSLAPLMKESPLNVEDLETIEEAEFKPKFLMGRKFEIDIAITEVNQTPSEEWWRLFERGYIDRVSFDTNPMIISARCPSALLLREYIREEREYGDEEGYPAESIMQEILDDNGLSDINLVVPEPSQFAVYPYLQKKELVMDALREIAHQIGWEVKYRYYNDTEDMELMFYEPDRNPEEVSWIFSPGEYHDVLRMEMDIAEIRNFIRVVYSDRDKVDEDGNPGKRETIEVYDSDSIEDYGEIFMELTEASTSKIETESSALRFAESALHDLKDPKADFEIDTMFFFPTQLHDSYEFTGNGIHFDHTQNFGVVSYRHELDFETHQYRTILYTRGKPNMSETGNPVGLHLEWFKREARPGIGKANKFFPPSQPVNVVANSSFRGVVINYSLNPEDDLDGYKVYCSDEQNFEADSDKVVAQGRSTQWSITTYYDESDEEIKAMSSGETYYLKVRAYDTSKNLGEVSDEVSAEAGSMDEETFRELKAENDSIKMQTFPGGDGQLTIEHGDRKTVIVEGHVEVVADTTGAILWSSSSTGGRLNFYDENGDLTIEVMGTDGSIKKEGEEVATETYVDNKVIGVSTSFENGEGQTVTVDNGLIIDVQ